MNESGSWPASRRTPASRSAARRRAASAPRLIAVPDPVSGTVTDRRDYPLVTLDALPGMVGPGGGTEFLVMAANPWAETLSDTWLGLVLPAGAEVSSVTPPAGAIAITERSGPREVVRTRVSELTPGSCVGLDVSVTLPLGTGPHRVIAFVTPCVAAEFSLTCAYVLRVEAATGTDGAPRRR